MFFVHRHPALFGISIFLLAMLASCGGEKPDAALVGAMPVAEVQVAVVMPHEVTMSEDLPGRLEAIRVAQVRARVEGVVEKRLFAEGTDVKAGTSLYTIDARAYRAALAAAEAELTVANLTVKRYRPLLEIKAVSQQEVDQAVSRLKQAEAALIKAKLDLEHAHVLAPISGRIGRSMVTEGALVGKSEATLMATIEQTDPIYVNFTRSHSEAARLRRAFESGKSKFGQNGGVELVLDDGSSHPHPGHLLFTDLAVDPGTGSIQMRAIFPNPGRKLLPGTFVRVRIPREVVTAGLTVPQLAVQSGTQGQFVMTVASDGTASVRPIKTGVMLGTDWLVTEGLSGGDKVILTGLQKVRPGGAVKVVGAEGAAPGSSPAVAEK
ncbi:MAG: efflux RND transporter periplasmic adaptor subunit [Rhodocyclaceae bacterium]|jgi:membrane fusion protein (multidrug efflux system)|nr:efflux RND transporter periplasmic adaptor subunit [Rhodocyclaceae bacterium]MBK6553319.1 efflux RND transporter periplasmic adaptor subunit [Rhodocyclaceae bacterium]MBK9311465.1 efflux RND transporter periplasmic adaptor subunit [Rhodocyclaceae bacterium]